MSKQTGPKRTPGNSIFSQNAKQTVVGVLTTTLGIVKETVEVVPIPGIKSSVGFVLETIKALEVCARFL